MVYEFVFNRVMNLGWFMGVYQIEHDFSVSTQENHQKCGQKHVGHFTRNDRGGVSPLKFATSADLFCSFCPWTPRRFSSTFLGDEGMRNDIFSCKIML